MVPPPGFAQQPSAADTPTSLIAQLTSHLLDVERVRSERVLNGVRAVVLVLLAIASALYATRLTPSLNRVNVAVLLPMLLWTAGQQLVFHHRGRAPRWLSTLNAIVDRRRSPMLAATVLRRASWQEVAIFRGPRSYRAHRSPLLARAAGVPRCDSRNGRPHASRRDRRWPSGQPA